MCQASWNNFVDIWNIPLSFLHIDLAYDFLSTTPFNLVELLGVTVGLIGQTDRATISQKHNQDLTGGLCEVLLKHVTQSVHDPHDEYSNSD